MHFGGGTPHAIYRNRVHASSPKGYLAIEKTTSQTILYSRRMKDRLDSPIHPPF